MRVEQVVMLEDSDKAMLQAAVDAKMADKIGRVIAAALKEGNDELRKAATGRDVDRPTLQRIIQLLDGRIALVKALPDSEEKDEYLTGIAAALDSAKEARQLIG